MRVSYSVPLVLAPVPSLTLRRIPPVKGIRLIRQPANDLPLVFRPGYWPGYDYLLTVDDVIPCPFPPCPVPPSWIRDGLDLTEPYPLPDWMLDG